MCSIWLEICFKWSVLPAVYWTYIQGTHVHILHSMLTMKKTKQLLPTISCSTFTAAAVIKLYSINANFSQIQLLTVLKVLEDGGMVKILWCSCWLLLHLTWFSVSIGVNTSVNKGNKNPMLSLVKCCIFSEHNGLFLSTRPVLGMISQWEAPHKQIKNETLSTRLVDRKLLAPLESTG